MDGVSRGYCNAHTIGTETKLMHLIEKLVVSMETASVEARGGPHAVSHDVHA